MYKKVLFVLILPIHFIGQVVVNINDSATHQPLIGAYLIHHKETYISSMDGHVYLPSTIDQKDTILISHLGYQSYRNTLQEALKGVGLSSRTIRLSEAVIRPMTGKDIIQRAFEQYLTNHLPYSFMQKAKFHEEFVNNEANVRVQDFEMEVYQYPKDRTFEDRTYYLGGGNLKLTHVSKVDDSLQIEKVRQAIGPKLSNRINFDEITSYSFVKGGNILNIVFTALLSDKIAHEHKEYQILGSQILYGTTVYEIEVKHFHKDRHIITSKIFIDKESYAVVAFSTLANKNMEDVNFFDFKTKVIMWFLGIKIKIKQYYAKIIFQKNIQNIWTVKDCIVMAPGVFERKNKIDGYLYAHYTIAPTMYLSAIPDGKALTEQNQKLIETTYKLKSNKGKLKPQDVYHQYKNKVIQ